MLCPTLCPMSTHVRVLGNLSVTDDSELRNRVDVCYQIGQEVRNHGVKSGFPKGDI